MPTCSTAFAIALVALAVVVALVALVGLPSAPLGLRITGIGFVASLGVAAFTLGGVRLSGQVEGEGEDEG